MHGSRSPLVLVKSSIWRTDRLQRVGNDECELARGKHGRISRSYIFIKRLRSDCRERDREEDEDWEEIGGRATERQNRTEQKRQLTRFVTAPGRRSMTGFEIVLTLDSTISAPNFTTRELFFA